jgi:uncharacterized protein
MNIRQKSKISIYTLLSILVVIIIVDFFNVFNIHSIPDVAVSIHIIFRFIGAILILSILGAMGSDRLTQWRSIRHLIWVVIPSFIISINNFPFSALFNGRVTWIEPNYRLLLFFIECISIGFFEEIIFRGVLLNILLNKFSKHRLGILYSILISSIVFSVAHLLNLSELGMQSIVLQMGYSFLMSMMWAIVYLKTKNLWIVIIMHSTFNFFGQVVFIMGTVNQRFDTTTIVLTSSLAFIAAIHSLFLWAVIQKEHQNMKFIYPVRLL